MNKTVISVMFLSSDLCRTGARRRLLHLRNLLARSYNLIPSIVLVVLAILAALLCTLPDLDLHATADDADSHGRKQVVRGVGVVVHAAVEHGRRVLANARADHGLATRVILDESSDVVNNARNRDESAPILRLLDKVVPLHDGKLLEWDTPVELRALLIKLLLQLLHAALLDFIGAELLKIIGKANFLHHPDEPLGRIILPPLNGIAVVGRELVVEVVVALAEGDDRGDDVVAGGVAVIEGLVADPVREAVHAEGGLLDEEDA